ncbi:MAG: hypothetical protein ACKV0T_32015, partial [Planctomycetales bacterium]
GRQSPDLHFGLGDDLKDQMLAVDLHWRDGFGKLHSQTISLGPGWHTIVLGQGAASGDEPIHEEAP